MTYEQLKRAVPYGSPKTVAKFYPYLAHAIERFNIDRVPEFIATLVHESGSFRYLEELEDGSRYEFRKDLGNVKIGDGVRFKGRGLIQITGRTNYEQCGKALQLDLLQTPELLLLPSHAADSAGWFWESRKIDNCATYLDMQIRVNGQMKATGLPNHWVDRQARLKEAQDGLGDWRA